MKSLVLIAGILLAVGCNGESDRPEVIAKLRGLGVAANPLVSQPSVPGQPPRTVELTVYAALPDGETATLAAYEDEPAFGSINLPVDRIAITPGSEVYQAQQGFKILTFKATVTVPPAPAFERLGGAGQVRYGFFLNVGDEEEKMVGTFLVYPDGAPELAWQHPTAAITSPGTGAVLASEDETELTASLGNLNDEELKVGWYVSGGEVINRRAKETKWKTPAPGPHTVLVTVRGRKSRGFSLQALPVTTQ